MKTTTHHKTITPVHHASEEVSLEEQIAQCAHELWQHRGHEHGSNPMDGFERSARSMNGISNGARLRGIDVFEPVVK
jgi:hypothetical protein